MHDLPLMTPLAAGLPHDLPLITTIAAGFFMAWVFGLFTQWLRLSPIVGYLLAGVMIGPHTPGFVGDIDLAHQLAEIGVILLMFGVGLHFHLKDLLAVKNIAIPGAVGQSLAAIVCSVVIFSFMGMETKTGAVIGMAMAVASTVVLMRVLMDADVLHTPSGHVAVGWLLVEDVFTIILLIVLPALATNGATGAEAGAETSVLMAVAMALLKLAAMVGIIMVLGVRIIPYALTQVARLRSRELFTLTVMVFSIAIAVGAYEVFGASMALGAFLAGMVVAQSPVSHQAAADALPLRDAFAVLFFVAVGMLFDPMFVIQQPLMMVAALVIILIVKPLAALLIVLVLGYSVRTALTVALALAQVGEFSFILSDMARNLKLMPDEGHYMLVGGAIISITLNPILFRSIDSIERFLKRYPRLWELLNRRAEKKSGYSNEQVAQQVALHKATASRLAVVVGYGPVGRTVDRLLRDAGLATVIVDTNMDTVAELGQQGRKAVFGDAGRDAILESAGVEHASHLVLTLPQSSNRSTIVANARLMNPNLKIFVRARYLREREELETAGATATIFEEAEAAVALARLVLVDTGGNGESMEYAVRDIRTRLILDNASNLHSQVVGSIMTPWPHVRRLSQMATLNEVRRQVAEQHFSRWPVVDPRSGSPVGYLLVKDLISPDATGEDWTKLIRPITVVSPDENMEAILLHFQRDGSTLCVVKDEQGRPLGIVTLENVLERIVGRIEDEYPRHTKISLQNSTLLDMELLNVNSRTFHNLIEETVAKIPSDRLPKGANLVELVEAREREHSTYVGAGVAIPHARCPGVFNPLIVFARSDEGIVYDPQSPELVHLVFMLITPKDQPDVQVLLLSQLASLAGNAEKRQQLRSATSIFEISELLAAVDADSIPQEGGYA